MEIPRVLRWFITLALGFLLLAALGVGSAFWTLRASLPQNEGRRDLRGLQYDVIVERDAQGIPTIRGSNRVDVARALGFIHAQERFFQMDVLRKRGAGELAELFGPALVPEDAAIRLHGFRAVARQAVTQLRPEHRAILEAYAEGVNAGLSALWVRPPEYLLLRTSPTDWQIEDSFLVAAAMFFTLQDSVAEDEQKQELIERALPRAAAAFFFPTGSDWEAAVDGTSLARPPIPDESVIRFSEVPGAPGLDGPEWSPEPLYGSNAWAVQGAASVRGAAIVANDMHLDLNMPNVWYRVQASWNADDGRERKMFGVTLPGVPVFAVASNGSIAWAFTNGYLDTSDIILLETDPNDADRYRTPAGWRTFEKRQETIRVSHAPSEIREYLDTIWGPVLPEKQGTPDKRVVHWLPHQPDALNLDLLDLENATTVVEALDIAPRCGAVPVQNLIVGDRSGSLAWTLIGRLPKRRGFDGSIPVSWADGSRAWDGWLSPAEYPRWSPPRGQPLWTANNRILGSPEYLALGLRQEDIGARAGSIRDDLLKLPAPAAEKDLFSIFSDNRSIFLERWQKKLLATLDAAATPTQVDRWKPMRRWVEDWQGRAAVDSVGYRLVRSFRLRVIDRVMEPILARCRAVRSDLDLRSDRAEQPVWTLLENQPAHLLNPRYPGYDALLADAVDAVLSDLESSGIPLDQATWGRRNTVRIQHPLSLAVPALGKWLDAPPVPLPGDVHMPRVQLVQMGPSERFVVAPGHEEEGILHMPGGQSGHFLSPYYRAGHEDWVHVTPTPLLAGPPRHHLRLVATR